MSSVWRGCEDIGFEVTVTTPGMTHEDGRGPPATERQVHGLRIVIDRDLCVGFGDCIEGAEEAFELDADGVVVFRDPGAVDRECLLRACAACPVDALTATDENGEALVP